MGSHPVRGSVEQSATVERGSGDARQMWLSFRARPRDTACQSPPQWASGASLGENREES